MQLPIERGWPSAARRAVALGLALVATANLQTLEARQSERYVLSGSDVAIYNLAGRLNVVGGAGSDIVVDAVRGGRDAAQLRFEGGQTDGRETLRVLYPSGDIVYPPMGRTSRTTINIRGDGTFGGGGLGLFSRGITVRGSGSGTEAYADLNVNVPPGRTVEIHLGVGQIAVTNVDGDLRLSTQSGSIQTDRTRGSLRVASGSGSVTVAGMEGVALQAQTGSGFVSVRGANSGEAQLLTGSGNVRLEDVRGTTVSARTGSGSVSGSDVGAGSLTVHTGSGGVELGRVNTSQLNADTGSGSIRIGLLSTLQSGRISTGSGGVTVTAPASLGATLDIQTGSGSINVGLPATDVTTRRNSYQGRLGDGSGTLRIRTGSGSVRLSAS